MRLGRADDALDALEAQSTSYTKNEAGEAWAIRASCQIVLGRFSDAEFSLTNARALAFSTGLAALEAEVLYVAALLAWAERRSEDCRADILGILSVVEPHLSNRQAETKYPFGLNYWRGRAFELRSTVDANSGRHHDRASDLERAFEEFDLGRVLDRYAEAAMLFNAAVLGRDVHLPRLEAVVIHRAESFNWSESLRFFEFLVYHMIGARYAFEGDHISALRSFRRAADRAPSVPMRLQAVLDRCRLIRDLGEELTAAEEIDYAVRLSKQIDWNLTNSQERAVLLKLAEVLAPNDAISARSLFDRYASSIASNAATQIAGNSPDRVKFADDRFAEAQVLRSEGELTRATWMLHEAFEIWSELGYDRQRALTACELFELTGAPQFADIVKRTVERFPSTPLARRMRSSGVVGVMVNAI